MNKPRLQSSLRHPFRANIWPPLHGSPVLPCREVWTQPGIQIDYLLTNSWIESFYFNPPKKKEQVFVSIKSIWDEQATQKLMKVNFSIHKNSFDFLLIQWCLPQHTDLGLNYVAICRIYQSTETCSMVLTSNHLSLTTCHVESSCLKCKCWYISKKNV